MFSFKFLELLINKVLENKFYPLSRRRGELTLLAISYVSAPQRSVMSTYVRDRAPELVLILKSTQPCDPQSILIDLIADKIFFLNEDIFLRVYSMEQRGLGKLIISQLVETFPTFNATRMFIDVYKRTRHRTLSRTSSIQSTSSHSIFKIHLCLGLPSSLFPTRFPTKTVHEFHISPPNCYIHHSSHTP